MRRSLLLLLLLPACGPEDALLESPEQEVDAVAAARAPCSATKLAEVLAPASTAQPTVRLGCSLTLPAGSPAVTKGLVLLGAGASGVRIDCAGGTLRPSHVDTALTVASADNGDGTWSRPTDVRVERCRIDGLVRVRGAGGSGNSSVVGASSRSPGHTARMQAAAPTRVQLDQVQVTAVNSIPIYLGPGVTEFSLTRSSVGGTSHSVGLYLDAESARNVIRDNSIAVDGTREQIALDGSADNKIFSNRFAQLDTGGIFLYRNCGEAGTIRHQSPLRNEIFGNSFFYRNYRGPIPSVWLASRNGLRSYCDDDDGFPFGSSASDLDFARDNVVAENRVVVRSVEDMILNHDDPNYLHDNRSVSAAATVTPGCTLRLAGGARYLPSGTGLTVGDGSGLATRHDCTNNVFTTTPGLPTQRRAFGCARSGDNAGCAGTVTCPAGQRIVALRAACELEGGALPAGALSATAWGRLRVERASDFGFEGRCAVGAVAVESGGAPLLPVLGLASAAFSCREHDLNGGDCAIQGEVECR